MSYSATDIVRDSNIKAEKAEDWIPLVNQLREHFTKKNAEQLWLLADDWAEDHSLDEGSPEYARGVYQGIIIAARELDGLRG